MWLLWKFQLNNGISILFYDIERKFVWIFNNSIPTNLINTFVPFWYVCFSKMGLRAGSNYSPTFSSNTGWPNWMAFSNVLKKLGSDSFITLSFLCIYIFLIHLLAWPCGSIQSGHLLDLKIMIPFYSEKESDGKPSMFHCLIWTGLPSTETKE